MFDWLFLPFLRLSDRRMWHSDLSRKAVYAELALTAATAALAAQRGGYKNDSKTLSALSEQLTSIGKSEPRA
jgi:hypothetical protein